MGATVKRRSEQLDSLLFYARMVSCVEFMPAGERAEFDAWDAARPGDVGSGEWPGFAEYGIFPPRLDEAESSSHSQKEQIPSKLRWSVWLRDDLTCQRCGTRENLSVDHIRPESKGGTLELENLQTLCRSCNSKKGVSVES